MNSQWNTPPTLYKSCLNIQHTSLTPLQWRSSIWGGSQKYVFHESTHPYARWSRFQSISHNPDSNANVSSSHQLCSAALSSVSNLKPERFTDNYVIKSPAIFAQLEHPPAYTTEHLCVCAFWGETSHRETVIGRFIWLIPKSFLIAAVLCSIRGMMSSTEPGFRGRRDEATSWSKIPFDVLNDISVAAWWKNTLWTRPVEDKQLLRVVFPYEAVCSLAPSILMHSARERNWKPTW